MYSWNNSDVEDSKFFKYSNFLVFGAGAGAALIIAVILNTFFADLFVDNPIIINILYVPAFVIGFLYGLKITEKAQKFIVNVCNNSIRLLVNYMEKFKLLKLKITYKMAQEICTNISFYEFEKYTKCLKTY